MNDERDAGVLVRFNELKTRPEDAVRRPRTAEQRDGQDPFDSCQARFVLRDGILISEKTHSAKNAIAININETKRVSRLISGVLSDI